MALSGELTLEEATDLS